MAINQVKIDVHESKSKKTRCVCCDASIFTCEKYWQVVNATTGKAVAGEKYCKRCSDLAYANWKEEIEAYIYRDEPQHDNGEQHLRQAEDYASYRAAGCTDAYWTDRDAGYAN